MSKANVNFTAIGLIAILFVGCYYYDCIESTDDFDNCTAYKTKVDFVEEKIQDTSSTGFGIFPQSYTNVKDYIRIYAEKTAYRWSVDIYGCSTYQCKDAEIIIIHDDSYLHSHLFKKGEFKISDPKNPDIGQEGDIFYHYFFNLKIDSENAQIDWDVIKGNSKCENCGYHEMTFPHIAG